MAGVIADFKYTDDAGIEYRYRGDKSNNVAAGNAAYAAADGLQYIPRNFTPRYILASAPNPVSGKPPLARKIPIGDVTNNLYNGSTTTIALEVVGSSTALTFTVTARRGEKMSLMGDLP
jgi:hypothetical protein